MAYFLGLGFNRKSNSSGLTRGLLALFNKDRDGSFHDWSLHGQVIDTTWLFDNSRDGSNHDFRSHNGEA